MDDEIIQEFLAESWENLSQLDTEIVLLEKEPNNEDLLASIFRTIHTIKGTCGFIGLTGLGSVAHSAENVLGKMRDGVLGVSTDVISLVLKAIDEIKVYLEGIEATGKEPQSDNTELIAKLEAVAEGGSASTSADTAEPSEPSTPPAADVVAEAILASDNELQAAATPTNEAEPEVQATPKTAGENAAAPGEAVSQPPAAKADEQKEAGAKKESSKNSVSDLSIRVNVNVLDSLMNLVGELVLTRNQLLQLARGDDESKYAAPITHLNRVTTDLQEGVMKTRMQPIGNAWSKLPRLVRDLAQHTGHQIELEMSGAETELDRTVLDAIKDPLTHMVRNSADHGIESPEDRRAAGKSETGTVKLNAYHEGGHVIISIEDDGAGINVERVLRKIIANGLVSEAEAANLSEKEILSYVFRPGLSTAEQVSSVSGRGVGMDVVKTQIERIGGTVDLTSAPNVGTIVKIKIPLTLAIISALVVESGRQSFAIPQLGVVELVRLAAEDRGKIEKIHDNEVFRLRDRLLPLVHLDEILGLGRSDSPVKNAVVNKTDENNSDESDAVQAEAEEEEVQDVNIVVVQVGENQFGLIVTEVFDTEEIVVKPVGSLLKDVGIFQGTTILGDGRVIMILDVTGVAAQFGSVDAHASEQNKIAEAAADANAEMTSLLLFGAGEGTTMSVPLSLVARLEEFPREKIEKSGDDHVVQYRGDLLPLQPISGRSNSGDTADPQAVIVFSEGGQSMGLMVNEIQDIIEDKLTIRMQSKRSGVLGTAIIGGKATDVIDTQFYLMQANPAWFSKGEIQDEQTILVIDDSMFFRQLVATALETENLTITLADSAVSAVEMIEKGQRYDLIVTDIDMPMMDGCEFAEWIRSRPETAEIPMIALSALSGSEKENRALQAGCNRFLTKFDAQQLISTIHELSHQSKMKIGVSA